MNLRSAASLFVVAVLGRGKLAVAQSWGIRAELSPMDPPDWSFGFRVAISGDTCLVGSDNSGQWDSSTGTQLPGVGSARVFVRSDPSTSESWVQQAILTPDDGVGTVWYGYTVAIDGNRALLGVNEDEQNQGTNTKAFIFERVGQNWSQVFMIDLSASNNYLPEVALDGDTAVIAFKFDYIGVRKTYVYVKNGSLWEEQAVLQAADGENGDQFGSSVSISGDTILIGASQFGRFPRPKGKAYVFVRTVTTWTEEAILLPGISSPAPEDFGYGHSVSLDGDTALIGNHGGAGAYGYDGFETYVDVWTRSAGVWTIQSMLQPDTPSNQDRFGWSVAVKGDLAIVGALHENGFISGAAHVFRRSDGTWSQQSKIVGPRYFGSDVALESDTALVSAETNPNGVEVFGSVFVLDNFTLTSHPTLSPTDDPFAPAPTNFPTFDPINQGGCFSGEFGDPHIITFDRLGFDCNAAGEFVMVKSSDSTFQIQERLTALDSSASCAQSSVSTGVTMTDVNTPTVQLSTPRTGGTSLNTINGCPIDFYVGGVATTLDPSDTTYAASNVLVLSYSPTMTVMHTDTNVYVNIRVEQSATFGCHFMTQVYLPNSYRPDETVFGLLGTCSLDSSDDWRASDGTILPGPTTDEERLFSAAYDYCTTNWCVNVEAESIFTYGAGESFSDTRKCDDTYANGILESQLTNPPQELIDICGDSVACLIDGICGDETEAANTLAIEEEIETIQENLNPTPSPWTIKYLGMYADFGVNSVDELTIGYDITVDTEYETELFQKDCTESITDIDITLTSGPPTNKNENWDQLVLAYDFDKAAVGSSSIWNDVTNQVEICQVVRLIIPAAGTDPKYVITEDERVLSIDFDLSANFQFDNGLVEGSVGTGSGSTNVDDYVQACKCDGVQSFSCDDSSPLLPNQELVVCIRSVSPDMEIDFLDSMVLSQDPSSTMNVIMNNQVEVPSITSREYVPGMNGVAVSTRVPSNLFTFSAGESITITGGVELKLVESVRGRKLQLFGAPSAKELDERAFYQIKVDIDFGEMVLTGDEVASSAASLTTSMSFVLPGTIFVLAYTMW